MRFARQYPWAGAPGTTLAGAVAGVAGGLAYAVVMAADLRVFRYDADDYLLLGGAVERRPESASTIGKGMHLVNSAILGIVFERLAYRQLPWAGAVNGMVFASAENAILYPILVAERHHPLIRSGDLASYWNATAFAQSVGRHLAYGAVVGWTLDWIMNRRGDPSRQEATREDSQSNDAANTSCGTA